MTTIQPLSYGVKEAAVAVNLSPATVWNLIRSGEITPTKIGGRTLITRDELQSLLNRGTPA